MVGGEARQAPEMACAIERFPGLWVSGVEDGSSYVGGREGKSAGTVGRKGEDGDTFGLELRERVCVLGGGGGEGQC